MEFIHTNTCYTLAYMRGKRSLLSTQSNGNNSDMEEDTGYLQLAYITGNTTCRVNSSSDSCYYSIYSDDNYGLVVQAIVSC